ncbi:FAD-binding oxidoreductase [Sphingomonas canadensis]|uniref:FAD-binding oxidoreductase n=2 Tax=Sphingomonas canadensis TaxID=1219257 RepID=A0ABW3H5U8_9SPHN|nr:FAD-binding oxidoreductase [Sphingomonas canadensis]MCW3836384.1 FAD-binding oxidoreductase [Sphingomonas canadensis]
MTPQQQNLVETVRERFGPKSVTTDADAIAPWLSDWRGRYHGASAALLTPGSTGEVSAIVALAAAAGVALVPQGGNTGMCGGATPPADGSALLLSTRRMNHIRRISAEENLAVAEAGVILADLHEAALEQGRRFPLTLGARGSATIGGLVSTNAGGTQVLRFGNMRSLVAGVEAVLPDGSVHNGLPVLKKDNRGYDLNQLLIGAEGTLGIVTAASLRLVPAVASRAVAWVGLETPQAALDLLRAMEARTNAIESFEIVPASALSLVLEQIPGTRAPLAAPQPWNALIEAVASGADDEAPGALLERLLGDALEAGMAVDAVVAASEAQAEGFWRIRDSISEAERTAGVTIAHDISVPIPDMPRFMVEGAAAVESRFPGTLVSPYGHLGDGNVHFHVRAPKGADEVHWYPAHAPEITRFVHDLVVASGGSISAEHGIGQLKRAELERLGPPVRVATLRAIKHALDPRGILNPGKLVTLAPEAPAP